MRLFLGLSGVDLTSNMLDQLCLQACVHGAHQAKDRHMTLCFLGQYSYIQAQALITMLDQLQIERCLPVMWRSEAVSLFPVDAEPVAWAIQGKASDSLQCLMTQLTGVPRLKATFQGGFLPHVTLAYLSGQIYPRVPLQADFTFTQLVLYRSLDDKERPDAVSGCWARPRYVKLHVWQRDKQ